jgi:hypothetical protein
LIGEDGCRASLPPNSSTVLGTLDPAIPDRLAPTKYAAFATLEDETGTVAQHRLLLSHFKDLVMGEPQVDINRREGKITFASPVFVWAACIDLDGEADVPANCFDLLPGIPHDIPWPQGRAMP